MTVDLAFDKPILLAGDTLNLTGSFNATPDKTEVLLTIGVIRPDGFTEYPLYLTRFQPSQGATTFQGMQTIPYLTKMPGLHRIFAHIYVYSDSQQIDEEMTRELWILVLPSFAWLEAHLLGRT